MASSPASAYSTAGAFYTWVLMPGSYQTQPEPQPYHVHSKVSLRLARW